MSDNKQGKHKRYGRNKAKCARYFNEQRLGKHKLVRFKRNNIGKDWPETKIKKAVSDFMNLHYNKHQAHTLIQ